MLAVINTEDIPFWTATAARLTTSLHSQSAIVGQ